MAEDFIEKQVKLEEVKQLKFLKLIARWVVKFDCCCDGGVITWLRLFAMWVTVLVGSGNFGFVLI